MTENRGKTWSFAVHPAVADTLIGWYAMRLDVSVSAARRMDEMNEGVPAFLSSVAWKDLSFFTYQWYDNPTVVRSKDSQLTVHTEGELPDCVLRVRLVGVDENKAPLWVTNKYAFEARLIKDFKETVDAANMDLDNPTPAQKAALEKIADGVTYRLRAMQEAEYEKAARPVPMPLSAIATLCRNYDAYKRINSFAKLVALLNWYKGSTGILPSHPIDAVPRLVSVGNTLPVSQALIGAMPRSISSVPPAKAAATKIATANATAQKRANDSKKDPKSDKLHGRILFGAILVVILFLIILGDRGGRARMQ
jgi:hypothetical protein